MNRYQDELNAEYHRKQIVDEFKQIRLEQRALKTRPYRPGRYEQTMFNFANWMIATGKQLRKRYEVPAANCNNSPSKGFAH